ncbi:hypothetical protein BD410DRAFT_776337 [Rickenella mellea]|uniref:FCH-domain-containing protein n=1 Tax=Rickenella mellea TaxID=50990 RepID=A0A4Y7PP42_9AGAM|nr:hypothetical protein BD410DRAFT_776337 [Rickenella mellea]
MTAPQTYGQCLPDQVESIAKLSDVQLELLSDIRDIYKDRALLEKEYAGKLQVLAKKAADKKAKRLASLVVGVDPAKQWSQETIKRSTLDTAYAQLISSIENVAQDHLNFSDMLTSQVVDAMKGVGSMQDEAKKKQMQFYQKILADRDKIYSDRVKTKHKYDEECSEVESYRQKQGKAHDDRHATRAAKQFEQQKIDMLNGKNTYIISTEIANTCKKKFYNEDLPALEDQFQLIQKNLISRVVFLLQHAQAVHARHLTTLQARISDVQTALSNVDVAKDQDLFIEYNKRPFTPPGDWGWEPCSTYYDKGEMSVDPEPKVFLQNKLSKCRAKMDELTPLISSKQKEVDKTTQLVEAYSGDPKLGNIDEVTNNHLDSQHQLTLLKTSASVLKAEMDTILSALGDDEGGRQPHTFKFASFSIPTPCGYCKTPIWGLNKQGMTCKTCRMSVHAKCELKVPAECGSARPSRTSTISSSLSRSDTRASTMSAASTPTASSFTPSHRVSEESHRMARVAYDFVPTSPFELAVTDGMHVHVIEEDDGSGWVKVADEQGGKGLIPASYVEPIDDADDHAPITTTKTATSSSAKTPFDSGEYVRGVYEYSAQGPDELDVREGELIELSSGPSGGKDYADGWWEGFDGNGKKGIFPSNYVEPV